MVGTNLLNQYPDKLTFALVEFALKDGSRLSVMRGYIVSVHEILNKPLEVELRTVTGNIWVVSATYANVIDLLKHD